MEYQTKLAEPETFIVILCLAIYAMLGSYTIFRGPDTALSPMPNVQGICCLTVY